MARKEIAVFDNLYKMARIEREIERSARAVGVGLPEREARTPQGPQGAGRMEAVCEKDGWVVSVAMLPPENTTLFIEKFSEGPIGTSEGLVALKSARAFAMAEFGTDVEVIRDEETIPNTRAPYHVRLRLRVDAAKRVQELAA